MELKTWLSAGSGRVAALARELRLPQSFVSNMGTGKKPIPVLHMARIERATHGAVTRAEMRPNDWHEIWPELASQTVAQKAA